MLHFHLSTSSFKKEYEITYNMTGRGRKKSTKNYIDLMCVTVIYLLKFRNIYILGISVTTQYYRTVKIEITTDLNGRGQQII